MIGSAATTMSAGVIGSALIVGGVGNIGCFACVGCVGCIGCVGCVGCVGLRNAVGQVGVRA